MGTVKLFVHVGVGNSVSEILQTVIDNLSEDCLVKDFNSDAHGVWWERWLINADDLPGVGPILKGCWQLKKRVVDYWFRRI